MPKVNNNSGQSIEIPNLWYYMKVPIQYKYIYDKLLIKLADIGTDLLKECNASCKGENKEFLACWNMFQAACAAYNNHEIDKANLLIKFISAKIGIGTIEDIVNVKIGYSADDNIINHLEHYDGDEYTVTYEAYEALPIVTTFDYTFNANIYKKYTIIHVPLIYHLLHLVVSNNLIHTITPEIFNNDTNDSTNSPVSQDYSNVLIYNGEIKSEDVVKIQNNNYPGEVYVITGHIGETLYAQIYQQLLLNNSSQNDSEEPNQDDSEESSQES